MRQKIRNTSVLQSFVINTRTQSFTIAKSSLNAGLVYNMQDTSWVQWQRADAERELSLHEKGEGGGLDLNLN